MKIICSKEEFADMVITCVGIASCSDCVLSKICEHSKESLIQLCEMRENNGVGVAMRSYDYAKDM